MIASFLSLSAQLSQWERFWGECVVRSEPLLASPDPPGYWLDWLSQPLIAPTSGCLIVGAKHTNSHGTSVLCTVCANVNNFRALHATFLQDDLSRLDSRHKLESSSALQLFSKSLT